MDHKPAVQPLGMRILLWLLLALVMFIACSIGYTFFNLSIGRLRGVYPTPQEAIQARADHDYSADARVVIEKAGPNYEPGMLANHHWYVIYKIYASSRKDGTPLHFGDHDGGGWNFVQTKEGWVALSEGQFPSFIALWMKILNLNGSAKAETVP
jgi:hypothetical protein